MSETGGGDGNDNVSKGRRDFLKRDMPMLFVGATAGFILGDAAGFHRIIKEEPEEARRRLQETYDQLTEEFKHLRAREQRLVELEKAVAARERALREK